MTLYIAPNFLERLNVFEEVNAGNVTIFSCRFIAHPRPEVRWFKDDLQLQGNDRIILEETSVRETETSLCLKIEKVGKDDEGAYRCSVENVEGVASTTGYLSVNDLSVTITDPDPIDQSLLKSLLLRDTSQEMDASSQHLNGERKEEMIETENETLLERSCADAGDNDDDFNAEKSVESLKNISKVESIMNCIFANSVELDTSATSSNDNKLLIKEDGENTTIVNIFTIMNKESSMHDSFRPIEINKFDSFTATPPIPIYDVNKSEKAIENSDVTSPLSQPGTINSNNYLTSMDTAETNNQDRPVTPGENKLYEQTDKKESAVGNCRYQKAQFSRLPDDGSMDAENVCNAEEVRVQEPEKSELGHISWKKPNFSGEKGDDGQLTGNMSANHKVNEFSRLVDIQNEPANLMERKVPRFVRNSWPSTVLPKSLDCTRDTNSSKITKWLKKNHVPFSDVNDGNSETSADVQKREHNSTILRRSCSKPRRRVCYFDDSQIEYNNNLNPIFTGASPPPPTPDIPFTFDESQNCNQNKSAFQQFPPSSEMNTPDVTWNCTFTRIFAFPQVLAVFFVLLTTIYFVSHQVNPVLVTILVSSLWTLFIYATNLFSNITSKQQATSY